MTLRKKLILILSAVTICPMIFIGLLGYFSAKTALENLRMDQLKSITDLKVKKIEDFFSDQRNHVRIAQRRPTIKKYAAVLSGQDLDFDSPAYKAIQNELDGALKMYNSVYDYSNVMLANPQGRIVYVLNRFSKLADLNHFLPDLWQEAFKKGKSGIYLSDVFRSKSRSDSFSVFITAPLHSPEEKVAGVIALEVDMASIFALIGDLTGMGKTGETLIARKDGEAALILNPLRHDKDAALKRKAIFSQKQAIPIQKALDGNAGHGVSLDYRGEKVVAAWQRIPVLGWGIVAKVDASEAFEPATTLRNFVLMLVIAVIALSIPLAFLVTKSISDPIQVLQEGTEAIGSGNLDFRIGTKAKDEIGQLGRAFDLMAEKLKTITASRDELDREVHERERAEGDLKKSMSALEERVKELNCLFEISRLVEKRELSIDETLQGIVDLIPPALQYPDITCASINLNGKEYKTENFSETAWRLSSDIIVNAGPCGKLMVCYLEKKPERDEGPFQKEERKLLDAITERIGRIIERHSAKAAMEESEKRFRDLVEHSLTGISIIHDGQIVYQNPKQERLLGPLPRPIKFKDTDSIHPDDIEKVNTFSKTLSSGNLPVEALDFRFYTSSENANRANMKWVHCQTNRIEYQGKDAILVNIMDMTEAKQLEQLLTIQDRMASLGRVAAGIAHEIRNPLSGINIYINTLKKLYNKIGSEDKAEQIFKQIHSASQKIESVIRRVMDFARPSEPKLTLIDMNQPIADAINLTAVTMRKSGIKLETRLAENLPPSYADKNLIEDTVLNLLNNAAEAMKTMEAGKKIVVSSAMEDDRIVILVSDSGPGVPSEIREKIFDPYYTTRSEGTGIGLSISHRIITDHGGSLKVSKSHLGGAEFRVEIPIKS